MATSVKMQETIMRVVSAQNSEFTLAIRVDRILRTDTEYASVNARNHAIGIAKTSRARSSAVSGYVLFTPLAGRVPSVTIMISCPSSCKPCWLHDSSSDSEADGGPAFPRARGAPEPQSPDEDWNAADNFLRQMMFVSGETTEPSTDTIGVIEQIVQDQVKEVVSVFRLPESLTCSTFRSPEQFTFSKPGKP